MVEEGIERGFGDTIDTAHFNRFQLSFFDQFEDREVVDLEDLSHLFSSEYFRSHEIGVNFN